eukprot:1185965-Prorocentrum_minimum.AAC.1
MNHIQQFVTQCLEKPLSQTDLQLLAKNFQFRNGPCDICGGPCFCLADDNMLVDRLVDPTFPKPVGCFVFTSRRDANLFQKTLNVPLTTWQGRNRWGMYIVVATARPTATINGLNGTIAEVAFSQAFIDEKCTWKEMGLLYGYRLPDSM